VKIIIKDKKQTVFVADFLSGALDTYALRIAMSSKRKKAFELYKDSFRALAQRILVG
jgi:hypothetical protein